MCIASLYEQSSFLSASVHESDVLDDPPIQNQSNHDHLPKIIVLHDTDIVMKKRNQPAIPKYQVVSENKDSEKIIIGALTFHSMEERRGRSTSMPHIV